MKSFKKAFFVSFICLVMVFSMLPLQAFATDDFVFDMPFSAPVADDHHFYFEVLFKHKESGSYFVRVFTFSLSGVSLSSNDNLTSNFSPLDYFTPRLGYDSVNNKIVFKFDSVSSVTAPSFSFTWCELGSDNYIKYHTTVSHATSINIGLSSSQIVGINAGNTFLYLISSPSDLIPFTCIYDNSSNYTSLLLDILSNLTTLVANDETKLQALNDMLDRFNTLISNTDNIESQLDIANSYLKFIRDYIQLYFPEMTEVLWYIDTELLTVIEKLDKIIDLLEPDTEVNVSTLDPSNFNEYNKAEQSLLDNSNVDVSGALNVEIDQNALMFIWPLAERVLNTHPQVIGLVFTILSISIVALVLGRKGG